MRIGIDARMLGKGFGIGRYVEQLVRHLGKTESEHEFVLFVNEKKQISDIRNQISSRFKEVLVNIPWYTLEEQVKFKKIIKKEHVNLMHFPHWNVPFFYNDPFVLTIHDLTMFHYPRPEATTLGPVKFWFKDKAHRLVIKHAVKKAKHIITTSEFTRQDVHKTLHVPMDKMTTIYQAPFENRYQISDIRYQNALDKYGVDKPYVLYVGAAYPHKNLEGLIEAWKVFEEKYGREYQLVLAGKRDVFWDRILDNETMKQCNSVTYLGFVPDDQLTSLYANAQLFVFPSLYEGFGLPPLEAMSAGTPVVLSNRSCLPEVLGEGALYFDPESTQQIVDSIYIGLTDEDLRAQLKLKAREELKRYSWERFARETLGIYSLSRRD